MARLDFSRVAAMSLNRVRSVLEAWVPGGRYQGLEYVALNPTRSDTKPGSFAINTNTGAWSDFATGDKGGDLVSLVAYVRNISQGAACKELGDWLGISEVEAGVHGSAPKSGAVSKNSQGSAWLPLFPVPADAMASCPTQHPGLGKPSACWEYRDSDGGLLLKVLRFDIEKAEGREKEYRPLTYGKNARGRAVWQWKQPTGKRPLYGLDRLAAADQSATVILCEGEKAADGAAKLFPEAVAMSWPGGSKAIDKADFGPLAGRTVWYWPDHDKAGRESVPVLRKCLQSVKASSVGLVNVGLFAKYQPGEKEGAPVLLDAQDPASAWPDKSDAVDALAVGWTASHIALLEGRGLVIRPNASAMAGGLSLEGVGLPNSGRFRCTDAGLFYFDLKTESYKPIGAPLQIIARSRNVDGRSWGLLVSFADFDGHKKEWNIPAALFATEGGAEVVRGLMDRGYSLIPSRDARRYLLEYLGGHQTQERVRLVERMGWHGEAFLLPGQILGAPEETLHYYSDAPTLCKMAQKGRLESWRDAVSWHCMNSSRLTFAVSAAFAAPLLELLGAETTGFHFVGDSSLGKSTLLKVAASVYGNPPDYIRTWRATDNALEATAAAHNSCLLVLDEIGQIEPRIVGETVYMLGNGEGKARATETGGARSVAHRWRLVFLSSGEKTLLDHMAEAHKKPQAGMEIRLLAIPATPHSESTKQQALGIFESAGAFAGGAELSGHLMEQAARHHGVALVDWLQYLTSADREDLVQRVYEQKVCFLRDRLKAGKGQSHRAADKFALVAAAGEMATLLGLTGWRKGWATDAAEMCFRGWLSFRGGTGNLEDQQTLEHVRTQLFKFGESRFTRWDSDNASIDEHTPRTMERWGFRKTDDAPGSYMGNATETVYYFTPDGFKDMCKGLDWRRAARLMRDIGALETEPDGKRNTKKVRLPGCGTNSVWCYVVRYAVLVESDSTDEAAA